MEAVLNSATTQLGLSGIFLALFLLMFYTFRKDAAEHKEEYKEMSKQLVTVLEQNTSSNVKLCESIKNLSSRVS